MTKILQLLFDTFILPAFGKFALTFTIQGTTVLANGQVRKRVKIVGDNAYPVAGYDVSDASKFGLKQFNLNDSGTSFTDPVIVGVNQKGVLAEIVALKLLLSYPSGGTAASPTTPAQPVAVTTPDAGATTMTGSAAKPALTAVTTPGQGKAFADASDASGLTFFVDAIGLPA